MKFSKHIHPPLFLVLILAGCITSRETTSLTKTPVEFTSTQDDQAGAEAIDCYFANLDDARNHPCPTALLETVLGIDIKEPSVETPKLIFIKAYWNGPTANVKDFDMVGLYYQCPAEECHLIISQASLENVDLQKIFDWGKTPKSAIETVELDAGSGEYVKGWFFQPAPDQAEIWSTDLEIQRLYWATADTMFMILIDGNNSTALINKTDLVEIANSMK